MKHIPYPDGVKALINTFDFNLFLYRVPIIVCFFQAQTFFTLLPP